MITVSISEAKTRLSRLLENVEAGEEVIITRRGKPVAKLVSFSGPSKKRALGQYKGKVVIADDFDDPVDRKPGADVPRAHQCEDVFDLLIAGGLIFFSGFRSDGRLIGGDATLSDVQTISLAANGTSRRNAFHWRGIGALTGNETSASPDALP